MDAGQPEFWQQRYEAGEDRWDKGAPAPPLLEFLENHRFSGRVLVPGCGAGHDVRALAQAGAKVVGLDFAPAAISRARAFPCMAAEEYWLGDFFEPPPDALGTFDGIFEHTLFCAIPPARRPNYPPTCARWLRPGGSLLAIFYMNPGHEDGPPWGCTRAELDDLFGPWFRLEKEAVPSRAYEGREGRELLRLYRLKKTDAHGVL